MPRKPNYDRNDLIERARDLFWKRGWAGTSLKDLEATLQMKPGSFYAAFGSKEALFAFAMEKYAADGHERLKALAQKHGPVKALQRFPRDGRRKRCRTRQGLYAGKDASRTSCA